MYLAYALTVARSPKFSSPIAFTCMVHHNFPSPKFSCVRWNIACVEHVIANASFHTLHFQIMYVTAKHFSLETFHITYTE